MNGYFEITKREILASISLVAVMLLIGVLISSKISEHQMDKNEIYNKAVKIESRDMFEYAMRTNVGNAFVYGNLEAADTVTYPEIGGEYMSVEKVKEQYTRHTRMVTKTRTNSNGKTEEYQEEEEYWTWDTIGWWFEHCNKVRFLGVEFDYGQIYEPSRHYIDTQEESSEIRYVYYGSDTKYTGTMFANLRDKTINDVSFYRDMNIEETIEYLESGIVGIIFWIFWILLTGGCVFVFYFVDNKWLE